MRTISQLLLTLLLNACWQIALIAGAFAFGDWLLRGTAIRCRHLLWVCALMLSFGLPVLSTLGTFSNSFGQFQSVGQPQPQAIQPVIFPAGFPEVDSLTPAPLPDTRAAFRINRNLAMALLALYVLFLLYRGSKFFQAWKRTKGLIAGARPVEIHEGLEPIVEKCQRAIGVTKAHILCSDSLPVPLTVGVRNPLVILPEQLLREADKDLVTSAVGHELMHVWRCDYLLNLIYELVFLPLAFHPGAALIRRRINQTRELCCDELVAERLLDAEVYARSLVQLAGWAPPLRPLAANITVGIADADILEVRIMSLLKRSKASLRQKKLLLIAALTVLIVPCIAAGSFAFHFDIDPGDSRMRAQEPAQQDKEKAQQDKEQAEQESVARARRKGQEREIEELKQRLNSETNPEVRAKLKQNLMQMLEDRAKAERGGTVTFAFKGDLYETRARSEQEEREMKERAERDPQFRAELEARSRHQQEEREAMNKRQSDLARLAKIPMDQAIQIAISQQPGKVLECSLVGEHWEGEGQLAKPSLVLYHVVILPTEGTAAATVSGRDEQTYTVNLASVHVLINAVDGSVFKTSKETGGSERRKERP